MFDVDEVLVNLIADYPRCPAWWLAQAVGLSTSAVYSRLRRLVDGGVIERLPIGHGGYFQFVHYLPADALLDFEQDSFIA